MEVYNLFWVGEHGEDMYLATFGTAMAAMETLLTLKAKGWYSPPQAEVIQNWSNVAGGVVSWSTRVPNSSSPHEYMIILISPLYIDVPEEDLTGG
jgi:hypothetical protein